MSSIIDAGTLTFHEGLATLLQRHLDGLLPGETLEVRFADSFSVHDLRAWLRLAAHQLAGIREDKRGGVICRIKRGTAQRVLAAASADWGNYASRTGEQLDSRALVLGAAAKIPVHADPHTGFSPRGSIVEQGAPAYPFDVLEAAVSWTPEAAALYDQASAGHWNAVTDIPWNQLSKLDADVERAVCQLMTFLAENEFAALYVPAKWIALIHPHFVETILFLSTQVRDEARHIEAFVKRALVNGGGLQFSTASTQQSLKSLLDQDDFLEASFLLSVLGEGTFLDLLRFIEVHAPEPATRDIARRTRIDEARHVHFALAHIQHAVSADSSARRRLSKAVLHRASLLSDIRALNPLVEESLIILAAGGLSPERLPAGVRSVRQLHSDMNENRIKRLELVGFAETEARDLSQMHTPNFM